MFILFDSTLWNASGVVKIHRVVSEDKEIEKPYAVRLLTPQEEVFERFTSVHAMNRRFDTLSEQVGATKEEGC